MKWRSLKVLEETAEGCAIGFSDGSDAINFAGVISATQTGVNAGADAHLNAEKIVAVVNAHHALKDALESSERSLMQAIAISQTVEGCDTKRWVSALHQVQLALARTKEIDALFKKTLEESVLA